MKRYKQLTIEQRYQIYGLTKAGFDQFSVCQLPGSTLKILEKFKQFFPPADTEYERKYEKYGSCQRDGNTYIIGKH